MDILPLLTVADFCQTVGISRSTWHRGQTSGGRERSGRYDAPQGHIRGTTALKKRFDIARPLKQAVQARQSGDSNGMRA